MSGVGKDAALINALAEYAGVTVTEVARRAKVDPETLRKPSKGITENRLSQRTIEKLQDAFPSFPGWNQASIVGDRRLPFKHEAPDTLQPAASEDLVMVREIDLTFGMGSTYLDVPVTEEMHSFPRAWLRRYTRAAPDKLFFAQGMGDSMEPTLYDSDLLLIDASQRQLNMAEKIWAISYADCGMIKRLRPVPGGGIEIWSDNKAISAFTAHDGEMEIIGRVVAVQRKL